MQKIRLNGIPKRKEGISWREFGTEAILLDPRSGDYFEINEAGLLIWKYVDGQRTIGQIIEELAGYFDDDDLAKDTIEFIEDLIGKGIISI
jgi:hypothetical protein